MHDLPLPDMMAVWGLVGLLDSLLVLCVYVHTKLNLHTKTKRLKVQCMQVD